MNKNKSIFKLLAILFFVVGIILAIVAVAGYKGLQGAVVWLAIWGGFALAFWVSAFVMLCICFKRQKLKKQKENLRENTIPVMAEITDVDMDLHLIIKKNSIDIHPYYVYARYVKPDGEVLQFKSEKLLYNPTGLLQQNSVKIYVDLNNPKNYHMDLSSVLPENIELHKFNVGLGADKLKQSESYIMAETCGTELLGYNLENGYRGKYWMLDKDIVKPDLKNPPVDSKGRKYLGFWVLCKYVTPDQVTHVFASRGRYGSPSNDFIGQSIKVYYRGNDFAEYYVDSDRITELS